MATITVIKTEVGITPAKQLLCSNTQKAVRQIALNKSSINLSINKTIIPT